VNQLVASCREHRWRIAGIAITLAVIVAGKQYYRGATADDLRWILAPTAQLVSWTSGGNFVYEAGPGWVDPNLRFIIAPPCAGVNFALAAFLALALGSVMSMTSLRTTAARLGIALGLSYVATLVINTVRITFAIAMHRGDIDIGSLDPAEAHRIEGIIVYLCGLIVLYAMALGIERKTKWWLAVPIGAYLLITLILPAANGAIARGDFARHAVIVLGMCTLAIALVFAASTTLDRFRRTT
jgi:exosortase K